MCTLPTISMVYIGGYRGVAVLYVVVVSDTRARSPCRSCRAMGRGKWKSSDDDDEGVRCFRAIVPTSAFERNWANTLDRKRSHSLSLSFTFLRHTLSLSPSFNHSLSHTHYLSLSLTLKHSRSISHTQRSNPCQKGTVDGELFFTSSPFEDIINAQNARRSV